MQLLGQVLLIISRRVTAPQHEVARDASLCLAVEQELNLVLALLPRDKQLAWSRRMSNCVWKGLSQSMFTIWLHSISRWSASM